MCPEQPWRTDFDGIAHRPRERQRRHVIHASLEAPVGVRLGPLSGSVGDGEGRTIPLTSGVLLGNKIPQDSSFGSGEVSAGHAPNRRDRT